MRLHFKRFKLVVSLTAGLITGLVFAQDNLQSLSGTSDVELNQLLEEAAAATDNQTRQLTLQQIQKIVEADSIERVLDYYSEVKDSVDVTAQTFQPGDDTAVVYPIALPDRLVHLLWMEGEYSIFEAPVGAERLARDVVSLRDEMQIAGSSFNGMERASKQIYDWVIGPYLDRLREQNIQRLLFQSTQELRVIPLATLYDGRRYLIEEFAVVTSFAPSLTNTADQSFAGNTLPYSSLVSVSIFLTMFSY